MNKPTSSTVTSCGKVDSSQIKQLIYRATAVHPLLQLDLQLCTPAVSSFISHRFMLTQCCTEPKHTILKEAKVVIGVAPATVCSVRKYVVGTLLTHFIFAPCPQWETNHPHSLWSGSRDDAASRYAPKCQTAAASSTTSSLVVIAICVRFA